MRRLAKFQKKAMSIKYANAARAILVKRALYKYATGAPSKGEPEVPEVPAATEDVDLSTSGPSTWTKLKNFGGTYAGGGLLGAAGGAGLAAALYGLTPREKRRRSLLANLLIGGGVGAGLGLGAVGLNNYLTEKEIQRQLAHPRYDGDSQTEILYESTPTKSEQDKIKDVSNSSPWHVSEGGAFSEADMEAAIKRRKEREKAEKKALADYDNKMRSVNIMGQDKPVTNTGLNF